MKILSSNLVFLSLVTVASARFEENEWWSLSTDDACVIDGHCIKSHPEAGAADYNSMEYCTFTPKKSGILVPTHWAVEDRWDWLSLDGERFSGSFEKQNVLAGTSMVWNTDESVVYKGFEICLNTENEYWSLSTSDACVIDGRCIKSHPQAGVADYNNMEFCSFVPKKSGSLVPTHWDVEERWDWLSINGEKFSGSFTKMDVAAGSGMVWNTDESVVHKGFELCLENNPGSYGDPHVTKWSGEDFDFHGECDLVMLDNADFHHGLGMAIHIRTKIVTWWSHIQAAVVRIGEDTIEVAGGDLGKFYVNGVEGDKDAFQISPLGLDVKTNRVTTHQLRVRIDLGDGDAIGIETYKHFVRVNLREKDPKFKKFVGSVGLMGTYPNGETIGRDGKTMFTDMDAFGQEWQVLDSEHKLFRTESAVQHPNKCAMPTEVSAEQKRRRLGESAITKEEAEAACANIFSESQRTSCIYDVLATNDKDMAGAY